MPGMLPVINEFCVEQAVRTGLGLKAQINEVSVFDRKNYFYPDLPQGYQISQYKAPIVGEGKVIVHVTPTEQIVVGIERLHLEQDAGKSLHDQHPSQTYVDLNRSGVALMEIVSKPDMRTAEEAAAYLAKLRSIVRYLGTCDGNMEEGSMRADVNVSVRKPGAPLGTRCEIKNMNSIRFIGQAIEVEARRQIEIIEDGGTIDQETRLFDPNKGETRPMRSKEEAHDYRYFPDPDLVPLKLDKEWIKGLRGSVPELPAARVSRFVREYGLPEYDAGVLTVSKGIADYFEACVKLFNQPKTVSNWVMGELTRELNLSGTEIAASPVTPERLVALLQLVEKGTVSLKVAREIFPELYRSGKTPEQIVQEKGLTQVSDEGALDKIIDEVLAKNPAQVAQFKEGKQQVLGFLVGQVMKASGGKANPGKVNELLKKKFSS